MSKRDILVTPQHPHRYVLRSCVYWLTVVSISAVTFSVAVSSIAMGIAIGLWAIGILRSKGRLFTATPLDVIFLAYIGAELAVALFSPEPISSLINSKRLFLFSFVYLIPYSMGEAKRLEMAVVIIIAVASMISFVEFFSLSFANGHFLRLSLFQYFLTEGGIKMIFLLMILPFLFDVRLSLKWRLLTGLAILPLLMGLVLTQTRSSWLGCIGGVIIVGLIKNKKLLIGLVVLIVLFVLFAPVDFRTRAASIFDPTMTSNLTRIHMVQTGWKMFLDHPLAGFGDIDLRKYYITYIVPLDTAEGGHLHNNIMMLLVTLGIVGFSIVIALFIRVGFVLYRSIRVTRGKIFEENLTIGCFSAYVGFHINGLFEWNFGDHEIALLLWTLVGISLLASRVVELPRSEMAG
jgi:O-antigen ligase